MTMLRRSWEKIKLGSHVSFQTGKLNSNASKPNGKYPFFTCSQETYTTDTYSFDVECVLLAGNNANGIYPLKYFHGKFDAYQRTYVIRSLDTRLLSNRYLYYALSPKLELMRSISTGAATKFLTLTILKDIEIDKPPLEVQERIASILSAYDDLIDNNTRRIKILEQMAQMLYREWFLNFRFPGYQKAKMVQSKMGEIPEGWNCCRVSEVVEIDPTTQVPREGLKPFVPMGSLSPNSMLITDVENREGNGGSKFRNGDTLFARITPCLENGKTGFVQFLPTPDAVAFGSTEFIVLRSRELSPEYVYLMARSDEFRDNAIKSMSGATGRQRVQQGCFDKFKVAHPPAKILNSFQNLVVPVFRMIYALSLRNENLRKTRDFLLPKLVSGEVSVEKIKAEVATQTV